MFKTKFLYEYFYINNIYLMDLKKMVNSKIGKYIFSILLGLGLATLFRKACNDRNCIVFKAPNLKKIENQIFKFENKCYKFISSIEKCNNNKKKVCFA